MQHPSGVNRKDQHVSLANQQYHAASHPDFAETRFVHHSLPESCLQDRQLATSVLGLDFQLPFFINAMTGGSQRTGAINQRLGILARETGLAIASGSVSAALSDPSLSETFTILRKENPNGLIFANLGAHHGLENARRAVELLEADALQIHVNVPQELAMPEGDRDFAGWLRNIEDIVAHLSVPVIVKEVGFGMSRETIQQLAAIGVQAVDVSGRGGTDFALIENSRRSPAERYVALNEWGQSTPISMIEAMEVVDNHRPQIIASGGIKNAMDITKSLALGADLVGISSHMLQLVKDDQHMEQAIATVHHLKEELVVLMTALRARTIADLRQTDLVLAPAVAHWCQMRGIDASKYANRSQARCFLK